MAPRKKAARKRAEQSESDLRDNHTRSEGDLSKLSHDRARSELAVSQEPVRYVTGRIVAEVPAKVLD